METIKIMFTRGDHATQPGGVILRKKPCGEFVTHCFNRLPNSRVPTEFFTGHYFHGEGAEQKALGDYEARSQMVENFGISEAEIIARGG